MDLTLLDRALVEWRRGEYYDAHEALEDFAESVEDNDGDHRIALALVHLTAAMHKLKNRVTPTGVPPKLEGALAVLRSAPPRWRGLDLADLRAQIERLLPALPALVDGTRTPRDGELVMPRSPSR